MNIKPLLIGICARIINKFVKVEPKNWVFGSDKGETYREGAKYLIEYTLKNHPDHKCTFITQSPQVMKELEMKGIPCLHNYSWKALITIAKAEAVFTTQSTADVRFAYRKKGRRFFYMMHGMSNKRSWKQLPKKFIAAAFNNKNRFIAEIKERLSVWLTIGYNIDDCAFMVSTSDFFVPYIKLDFGDDKDIKNIGMPRNDGLFDHERIKNEKWVKGIENKFIITYMPTHRAYGTGSITPTPFQNRPEIQQWMRDNNIVLLMKNHPNFIPRIKDSLNNDAIIDITKMRLDPQVCLYHSDVLITDHSSVWIDYLLLKRPIIFYMYDDFEKDDVGLYYNVKDLNVGHMCYYEDELFKLIKEIKYNYDKMSPSIETVSKFHTHVDCKNSERYFYAVEETFRK